MLSRRTLLRAMMLCLGLTALVGIAGIFLGGWDLIGRLMGTAVAGAATAVLMLWASAWMDVPAKRSAGTWAMGLALAQFGLVFAAIWSSWLNALIPIFSDERFWLTALALAMTGWPGVRMIAALESPSTKRAAQVGLGIDAVVLALLLPAIWWPGSGFGSTREKFLGMAVALGGHGVVACLCLVGWRPGDRHWWRWIGVVAPTIATAGFWYGVWADQHGDPTILFVIGSVAVLVAHANLMLLVPLKAGQTWLRVATLAAMGVTIALVDAPALAKINDDSLPTRVAIASGILTICGTLAMVVLARLNRGLGPPTDGPELILPREVTLTCPVCHKKLTVGTGPSSCDGCGLRVVLQIEAPRCAACGYVLLHHKGPTCPECGAPRPELRRYCRHQLRR